MKHKLLKQLSLVIFLLIIFYFLLSIFYFDKEKTTLSLSNKVNKYELITHNGEKFDSKLFSDFPALIFFGFLNCPDVCPFTLTKISEIIEKLDNNSNLIKFYFVTVDPERDTKLGIKEYLEAFNSKIIGVTGSPVNIENFLKYMHVYSKKVYLDKNNYTMDHSSQIFIFDKEGVFFGTLSTEEKTENSINKILNVINGA